MGLHERLIDFCDQQFSASILAQRTVVRFEKTAAAGLSFDDAEVFEFGIGFGDGVAVDSKFFSERANRRKGFAGTQGTGSGGDFDLIYELKVDGFAGFVVDLK